MTTGQNRHWVSPRFTYLVRLTLGVFGRGERTIQFPYRSKTVWIVVWTPRKYNTIKELAERVGFEPTLEIPLITLSKRAPSATRPSLRRLMGSCCENRVESCSHDSMVYPARAATVLAMEAFRRGYWWKSG